MQNIGADSTAVEPAIQVSPTVPFRPYRTPISFGRVIAYRWETQVHVEETEL